MSAFEFLTAFVSILIGLAVADLATSLHRLLRAGRLVKWDWAAPAAALMAGLQVMAQFWVFWFSRAEVTYDFASTSALALVLVMTFLMASAALPDEVPADGLDLRAFYERNSRYFWIVVALYAVAVTTQEGDIFGSPEHRLHLAQNAALVGLTLVLAFVTRRWVHALGLTILIVFQVSRYFGWTVAA